MRLVLVILAMAIFIGLAYHALASPDTTTDKPSFRPETATRAKQHITSCTQPRMFILAQRLPDGTRKPVAMMFVPGTCK